MIVSFGHDERGRYSGGTAGDQTGTEGYIRSWYAYPNGGWDFVLRYPDRKVGQAIATKAENAAKNENIGYDQGNRLSLYAALSKVGWKVKDIKTKVETDCSATACAITIAVGMNHKINKLAQLSPGLTTYSMEAAFKAAGFKVLKDKKYLISPDYLLEGDILVNVKHHTITNISDGKYAKEELLKLK